MVGSKPVFVEVQGNMSSGVAKERSASSEEAKMVEREGVDGGKRAVNKGRLSRGRTVKVSSSQSSSGMNRWSDAGWRRAQQKDGGHVRGTD